MQEYDQIADWYVTNRDPEAGIPTLRGFAHTLPASGRILDLGCGDGIPISQFLIREGFDVVAVDSSPEMIARYRRTFPDVPARCERAEQCTFPDDSFAAVVAWGVLFHLSEAEQRTVIEKVARWLKTGGWFLFTSGKDRGTREGTMNGVTFRYMSLGVNEYCSLMRRTGMKLEGSHHDAWENFVCIARKDP
jgi:SAM-dependent methyltransferase